MQERAESRQDIVARLTGPGGEFELIDTTIGGALTRSYVDLHASLRDLVASTVASSARDYLVLGEERLTYTRHLELVAALAHRLRSDFGVAKGDRVAIAAQNLPEWVVAFWATQVLGAIAVPLNASWSSPELVYALDDSETTVLIADGERIEALADARPKASLDGLIIIRPVTGLPLGGVAIATLLHGASGHELPAESVDPGDASTIIYTSGTTGRPKGAILTHHNHLVNLANLRVVLAVEALATGVPVRPDEPAPCAGLVLPFFHVGGLTNLYDATAAGATCVLIPRWKTRDVMALIERERVTTIAVVPALLRRLVDAQAEEQADLSSLTEVGVGGAPMPQDLPLAASRLNERGVATTHAWGLTETSCAIGLITGAEYLEHLDTVGRPVPIAEVCTVHGSTDERLPPGGLGEICVRGPNLFWGYWKNPEATADALRGGWFHTGDIGFVDDEGYIHVVDRLKDVIIRGGENVYSAEVEAALLSHPAVADVAVVGARHQILGEEVAAVVQLAHQGVSAESLDAHLRPLLAAFKIPTRYYLSDEPLPRNVSGKSLKRELRGLFDPEPSVIS